MASLPSTTATPAGSASSPPAGAGHEIPLDDIQRDNLSLIGHMASSIAHELSNPLATIVASTQAMLSFWPRLAPGREDWAPPPELAGQGVPLRQLREDLELILAEARRAGDIVHGLLASARHHPPEWRYCWAADIVRRSVALSRHHLKLHNISLQAPWFDPEDGYPLWSRMRGDANQLQQVLLNLIINAQQSITATRGFGSVRVSLSPSGSDAILITVEDDGPGVPEVLRDQIFQPFFTTKPAGEGTGLGLSISAGIVRAHGGDIQVAANPTGGAIFQVVLPSLAGQERLTPGPDAVLPPLELALPPLCVEPPHLRAVLLVDDEPGIRRSVGRFLRRYGFHVTDVPNAQVAITALETGSYDLIVTDLRMPGLSGEEFFAFLGRNHPAMLHRVVFTSGDMQREETRLFLAECGCPALQKPYGLPELVHALDALCPPLALPDRRASA